MAKKSMIQRDLKRTKIEISLREKRKALKAVSMDKSASFEERLEAQSKLTLLPRDSSKSRKRNRCFLTGRPRGYYRKFGLSRIALRELGNFGEIPGLIKSSW